jgi:hypothetical protein
MENEKGKKNQKKDQRKNLPESFWLEVLRPVAVKEVQQYIGEGHGEPLNLLKLSLAGNKRNNSKI